MKETSTLLNFDLNNLKGEKWMPVPDTNNRYLISNYGRIKSMKGAAKLMKPHLPWKLNSRGKKQITAAQAELSAPSGYKRFTIPRLVYFLFVKRFDISDTKWVINYKDGNLLNCYYRNLILKTKSEVIAESYQDPKRRNNFRDAAVPVCQYNKNGKFIQRFDAFVLAGEKTGFSKRTISLATKTKKLYKGYYWRTGKPKTQIKVRVQTMN